MENYLQYIGYGASLIVAISMTMNSIVKFRWINLCGAITFFTYGFLIEAYPVAILNGIIVGIDIFYLSRIYLKKELFDTLEVRNDNKYLIQFLKFHDKEIQKFFPNFTYKPELNTVSYIILRNMAVSGVFLAHKEGKDELVVGLDYVITQYRDYKNGKYIYHRIKEEMFNLGISKIVAYGHNSKYIKYLKKLNFEKDEKNRYVRIVSKI